MDNNKQNQVVGYRIIITKDEFFELSHSENKEYVAGFLLGRADQLVKKPDAGVSQETPKT